MLLRSSYIVFLLLYYSLCVLCVVNYYVLFRVKVYLHVNSDLQCYSVCVMRYALLLNSSIRVVCVVRQIVTCCLCLYINVIYA